MYNKLAKLLGQLPPPRVLPLPRLALPQELPLRPPVPLLPRLEPRLLLL